MLQLRRDRARDDPPVRLALPRVSLFLRAVQVLQTAGRRQSTLNCCVEPISRGIFSGSLLQFIHKVFEILAASHVLDCRTGVFDPSQNLCLGLCVSPVRRGLLVLVNHVVDLFPVVRFIPSSRCLPFRAFGVLPAAIPAVFALTLVLAPTLA